MIKFFSFWGKFLPNIKVWKTIVCLPAIFFSQIKMAFHGKKQLVYLIIQATEKVLLLKITIILHNTQVILWVFTTSSNRIITKHVLKGQDLMKLIIFTDSLRTFLSKTRFFFHKSAALRNALITNVVWYHCLNLCKILQV